MTRIVNISTIPDRDARIDLQPNNRGTTLYSVDPITGMPLDSQYTQTDSVGQTIETDGEGLPQLGIQNPVSLISTKAKLKYNRLLIARDTTIGELTVGARDSVLSDEPFGTLCSTDDSEGNLLLDEISRLKAEIARLNGLLADQNELNATIDQLRAELSDVTDELEVLLTTVEDLRECNASLETAAESRDQAVQELSEDNHRLTLQNAYLRSEVLRLGGRLTNVPGGDGTTSGGDFSGGVVQSQNLNRIRSIGEFIIDRLSERTRQNLSTEISVVRNSVSRNDVYESLDLLLSNLAPSLLNSTTLRTYIDELETLLGRGFTYIYEQQGGGRPNDNNQFG